jgi:hypothetical protein
MHDQCYSGKWHGERSCIASILFIASFKVGAQCFQIGSISVHIRYKYMICCECMFASHTQGFWCVSFGNTCLMSAFHVCQQVPMTTHIIYRGVLPCHLLHRTCYLSDAGDAVSSCSFAAHGLHKSSSATHSRARTCLSHSSFSVHP